MTDTVLMAHSGFRYLVLLAGVAALLYALFGWGTRRAFDRTGRVLGSIFTVLLDIQVLIGIVNLVVRPFRPMLIGHLVMMIAALVIAHMTARRTRGGPATREAFRFQAIGILITIGIIAGGIMAIGRSPV